MTNSWWEWVRDRERDWNKSVYNRATRVQYRNQKIDSGIIYYACVLSSMQRVGFSVTIVQLQNSLVTTRGWSSFSRYLLPRPTPNLIPCSVEAKTPRKQWISVSAQ